MHFLILGVKRGFWAIPLVPDMLEGQARALFRRGKPSSFQKKFEPKFWPIGLASRSRQSWSKNNTPTFRAPPRRTPHPNQKFFFNRTNKTCCIRRGFEQLSSYSGWRVITKKARANLLARAVVLLILVLELVVSI